MASMLQKNCLPNRINASKTCLPNGVNAPKLVFQMVSMLPDCVTQLVSTVQNLFLNFYFSLNSSPHIKTLKINK